MPSVRAANSTPATDSGAPSRWLRLLGLLLMLGALALVLSRAPERPVDLLVARWAPPPSDFIDVEGLVVHVRDEGPRDDPAPVVLIHGTAASLHTWEGWAAALRTQRRVITFDLPGFGLTGPNDDGDYRGDTYARFALALIDTLRVQRFIVGGNSLGGEVAWRIATLAPQRVERLILVDASGYEFEPVSVPIGFVLARIPLLNRLGEWVLPRALVDASVRDTYGDPSKVTPTLVDRYFELTLREGNRRALAQRMAQLEPGIDIARLRTLRVPTLVLWGGRDRLIPVSTARRFESDIAGSRVVIFDDLGHVPQEEDAARTVAAAKAFIGAR